MPYRYILLLIILLSGCQKSVILKHQITQKYRVGDQLTITPPQKSQYDFSFQYAGKQYSNIKYRFQSPTPFNYTITLSKNGKILKTKRYTITPQRGNILQYIPQKATLVVNLDRYPDTPIYTELPQKREGYFFTLNHHNYHLSPHSGTCVYQGFYFSPRCPPIDRHPTTKYQKTYDLRYHKNYYLILADAPLTVFSTGDDLSLQKQNLLTFISPEKSFLKKPLLEIHEEHPKYLNHLLSILKIPTIKTDILGYRYRLLSQKINRRIFQTTHQTTPFILELFFSDQYHYRKNLFTYLIGAQKMLIHKTTVYYIPRREHYLFVKGNRVIIAAYIKLTELIQYIKQSPNHYQMRGKIHSGYFKRYQKTPTEFDDLFDIDQLFPGKTRVDYYFMNYIEQSF